METIDVKRIIKGSNLDKSEVARHLFPNRKFQVAALQRIIDGDGLLDSAQLDKLAWMANCTVSDLYTVSGWKATTEKERHYFVKGDYVATLGVKTNLTKVYHRNSMFSEVILVSSGTTTLSRYLDTLDKIIAGHEATLKTK